MLWARRLTGHRVPVGAEGYGAAGAGVADDDDGPVGDEGGGEADDAPPAAVVAPVVFAGRGVAEGLCAAVTPDAMEGEGGDGGLRPAAADVGADGRDAEEGGQDVGELAPAGRRAPAVPVPFRFCGCERFGDEGHGAGVAGDGGVELVGEPPGSWLRLAAGEGVGGDVEPGVP